MMSLLSSVRTFPDCSGMGCLTASPQPDLSQIRWRNISIRQVAFLNRAWEDVLALNLCLDTASQVQPLLDHAVNTHPSRCVGFEGLGMGLERITASLK